MLHLLLLFELLLGSFITVKIGEFLREVTSSEVIKKVVSRLDAYLWLLLILGEFTPENQQRLNQEEEKEQNKLDPWKVIWV